MVAINRYFFIETFGTLLLFIFLVFLEACHNCEYSDIQDYYGHRYVRKTILSNDCVFENTIILHDGFYIHEQIICDNLVYQDTFKYSYKPQTGNILLDSFATETTFKLYESIDLLGSLSAQFSCDEISFGDYHFWNIGKK